MLWPPPPGAAHGADAALARAAPGLGHLLCGRSRIGGSGPRCVAGLPPARQACPAQRFAALRARGPAGRPANRRLWLPGLASCGNDGAAGCCFAIATAWRRHYRFCLMAAVTTGRPCRRLRSAPTPWLIHRPFSPREPGLPDAAARVQPHDQATSGLFAIAERGTQQRGQDAPLTVEHVVVPGHGDRESLARQMPELRVRAEPVASVTPHGTVVV